MDTSRETPLPPPEGFDAATWQFILAHRTPPADPARLLLSASRYPGVDMHRAAAQVEGWQAARRKLPSWAATGGMLKRHLAPETLERLLRNELLPGQTEEEKGLDLGALLPNLFSRGKKEGDE